jgi:hypothetical protein
MKKQYKTLNKKTINFRQSAVFYIYEKKYIFDGETVIMYFLINNERNEIFMIT